MQWMLQSKRPPLNANGTRVRAAFHQLMRLEIRPGLNLCGLAALMLMLHFHVIPGSRSVVSATIGSALTCSVEAPDHHDKLFGAKIT